MSTKTSFSDSLNSSRVSACLAPSLVLTSFDAPGCSRDVRTSFNCPVCSQHSLTGIVAENVESRDSCREVEPEKPENLFWVQIISKILDLLQFMMYSMMIDILWCSVMKNEHFLFQGGFMVFHGFWLVSMVLQGGFMVFHGFCWFPWFFKVVPWFSLFLVGFHGFFKVVSWFSWFLVSFHVF